VYLVVIYFGNLIFINLKIYINLLIVVFHGVLSYFSKNYGVVMSCHLWHAVSKSIFLRFFEKLNDLVLWLA
jgi:hypothetical protein